MTEKLIGQLKGGHGIIMIADTVLPVEHWQSIDNVQGRWVVDVTSGDPAAALTVANRYGHAQQVEVLADGCARVICPNKRSAGHIGALAMAHLADNQITDVHVKVHALRETETRGEDAARATGIGMSDGAAWIRATGAVVTGVFDGDTLVEVKIKLGGG